MIKTFDCFMQIENKPEFKRALQVALESEEDVEVVFEDSHSLWFDHVAKIVLIRSLKKSSIFSKIIPAVLTYSVVENIINGTLNDIKENDIYYVHGGPKDCPPDLKNKKMMSVKDILIIRKEYPHAICITAFPQYGEHYYKVSLQNGKTIKVCVMDGGAITVPED